MLCEGKGMHQLIYLSTIYEKLNKKLTYSNELKQERTERARGGETNNCSAGRRSTCSYY